MDRAARKGFLVLKGGGNRRTRKGSPLANTHRQWCDARAKPQIIVYKAIGGRPVDQVVVDMSPLRMNGLFDDPEQAEEFLVKWKADILVAANNAGMEFRERAGNDQEDGDGDDEEGAVLSCADDEIDDENDGDDADEFCSTYVVTFDNQQGDQLAWATNPIWMLPPVSMGIFEGERSRAKAMAKELATVWEIPEETKRDGNGGPKTRRQAGARKGGKTKTKGLSEHRRKRGGGNRQAWM